MRIRVNYAKTEAMRYTGHLDLYRAWERLIRRANLPLAYTQGFSPHPKLNLSSALPLGFTSICEMIDIWLEETLPVEKIEEKIRQAAPPGIIVNSIVEQNSHAPALQSEIQTAEYYVTLLEAVDRLEQQVNRINEEESLPRVRRNKPYDLRPLIDRLELLEEDHEGNQRLRMVLASREGATGRPEEILDEIGLPAHLARCQRVAFYRHEMAGLG